MESVKSSNTSGLIGQKMQKKELIKKDIHNQEAPEDSDRKCCACWENYL
jgi:hypothetical protein